MSGLPIVDVSRLVAGEADPAVGVAIDEACRHTGFFVVTGHGADLDLLAELAALARDFFSRPEEEKAAVAMRHAGSAWRGWFPLGGELTSGVPDGKEGLYVGEELPPDHPRVRSGTPLHGPNLLPPEPAGFGAAVTAWFDQMSELAAAVLEGIGAGLGLPPGWFARHLTAEPTKLLRIFRYPPLTGQGWGVAEHTDYGLLTLLAQDGRPGLEVRAAGEWVSVPAEPDLIVCNIGDMLERLTLGRYRSTPHRVRNDGGEDRLSFPFFYDPSWDAEVVPLPTGDASALDEADQAATRWDRASPAAWEGTYGSYLTAKVARVFPELFDAVNPARDQTPRG